MQRVVKRSDQRVSTRCVLRLLTCRMKECLGTNGPLGRIVYTSPEEYPRPFNGIVRTPSIASDLHSSNYTSES